MREGLKVLVVDDEMPIRQELSSYHWEEKGFQLVGTAKNGKIALNMCRGEERPDIVITDITMPVMDGLELISHLKNEFPQMKYIILTCHQDFDYAKRAIQYNVVDYLLKSDISEEAIFSVLQKTQNTLEKEHLQIENLKQNVRIELAEMINADKPDIQEIRHKLIEIGIDLERHSSVIFLFVENRILSWVVVELAIRIFVSEYAEVDNWMILDQGCYCIVMNEINDQKVLCFLEQLEKMIQDKFSYAAKVFSVYGVISTIQGNLEEFLNNIKELNFWRDEHFINPQKILFHMPASLFNKPDEADKEDFIRILQESTSVNIVQNVIRWEEKNRVSPVHIKQLLADGLRRRCEISMPDKAAEILDAVSRSWDMDELSDVLLRIYQQEEEYGGRYEIRKARKIIEEQYGEDLSLASVAQQVNLSPQYFSKIFSETVGVNFVDYLMDVRMKRAQKLVLNTDKKVYEIAEEVGIPNYRYFTALFKKYYGATPKEYKNKGIGR